MPVKCTSLIIIQTFEDGRTATTTFVEPENVDSKVQQIEPGEIHATSLFCFDRGKRKTTLTVTSGERGVITVVTPEPGS